MISQFRIITGILTPLIFWITLLICGLLNENYSHTRGLVSHLGIIGWNSQYHFLIGMLLTVASATIFLVTSLKQARLLKLKLLPLIVLFSFPLSLFGAALYPLPLKLHGIMGSPAILVILSPIFALVLWNKNDVNNLKHGAVLTLFLMAIGSSVYFPDFLANAAGLKQRFFHLAWSFWFVHLGFSMRIK